MKAKKIITEEYFRNYADTQGWFDTVLYEDVLFTIKKDKTPSNMLTVARKVFKSSYVGKESYKDSWLYTIYCGDKETQKWLNAPIRGFATESSNKREMQKYLKEMQKALRETYNL